MTFRPTAPPTGVLPPAGTASASQTAHVDELATVPAGHQRGTLLARFVADVYAGAEPSLRARMLECLLKPVGPLAMAALAAGSFTAFLRRAQWRDLSVSIEDALRVSADSVFELARFVDQYQPDVLHQLAAMIADNPVGISTLSGSLLLAALRLWRPRRSGRVRSSTG